MIAHVAQAGEGRGRVVLHLTQANASSVALEAAVRVAQAFQSEIESLFVEDAELLDIAGLPFAKEISLCGRHSRPISRDTLQLEMRAAASALERRIAELARAADVPLHMTVVRNEPVKALAEACAAHGPWNVVALAAPLLDFDGAAIERLFTEVPGTTGLILVARTARRTQGRTVALVEDIAHFEAVLSTARRLDAASGGNNLTLLLVAETDEEAQTMDEQARLVIGDDETVEIVRARVATNAPGMAAELIRRLDAGIIVGRLGPLVMKPDVNLRPLAAVLECPLFLIR